jgi:hypothetical protein
MPPVSPQGSRGGLITAVVIFTIGFVASTIFAIYYGVALGKAEEEVKKQAELSKTYYLDTTNAKVTELNADRNNNPNLKEKTVLAASIYNTDELAKRILGASTPTTRPALAAENAADDVLAQINSKVTGAAVPNGSLVEAIEALTNLVKQQQDTVAAANAGQQAQKDRVDAAIKDAQDKIDTASKNVATAQSEAQSAKDEAQAAQKLYNDKFTDASAQIDKERQDFNDRLKKAELQIEAREKELDLAKKQMVALETKLTIKRVDPADRMVRQPDGAILTVASDDIVYINLGLGDHVVSGMTFEVYDKHDGIPPLGDGLSEENMPVGEASIEVQHVLGTSSQCRVTKLEPGKRIIEGDLIANLVYDRNVKYNFIVYGNFSLSGISQPGPADAETIKALVVRWGGKVQKADNITAEDVNVDTDFVVMGAEPVVGDLDPNETDVFKIKKHTDEVAAQKAYNDVLNKARELHIPIMNQNRFLYFCGYYDLAAR